MEREDIYDPFKDRTAEEWRELARIDHETGPTIELANAEVGHRE